MKPAAKSRTVALLGDDAVKRLENSRVAVVGLGGVGGHVLETLARSGVGSLVLIDGDDVDESNLNRQIIATADNVGMPKAHAAKQRVLSAKLFWKDTRKNATGHISAQMVLSQTPMFSHLLKTG